MKCKLRYIYYVNLSINGFFGFLFIYLNDLEEY